MRAKLKTGSEDLAALEAALFSTTASTEDHLQKSQANLSAQREPGGAGPPRVKRNHRQATSSLQKS